MYELMGLFLINIKHQSGYLGTGRLQLFLISKTFFLFQLTLSTST